MRFQGDDLHYGKFLHFEGIQIRVHASCPVHVLGTSHSGCVYVAVREYTPSPRSGITCKIFFSPTSSTHFYTSCA